MGKGRDAQRSGDGQRDPCPPAVSGVKVQEVRLCTLGLGGVEKAGDGGERLQARCRELERDPHGSRGQGLSAREGR